MVQFVIGELLARLGRGGILRFDCRFAVRC